MHGALKIFIKDLLELVQSRQVLAFLLVAPLLLLVLVGQIRVHEFKLKAGVVASDNQIEKLRQIRAVLDEFANLSVIEVSVHPESILSWMETEQLDLALIWEDRWRIYTQQTDHYKLQFIASLAQEIQFSLREKTALPVPLMKSAAAKDLVVFYPPTSVRDLSIVPPLIGLITVFLPFFLGSGTYVREREAGTLEILLLASGARWGWFFVGKILMPVLMGLTAFMLMLVSSRTLFGYGVKSGLPGISSLMLIGLITSACLGLAVSTRVRSQQHAYVVSAIYLLSLILLTGFFYPLDQSTWAVQAVSWLFPLTHLIHPLEAWISRGTSTSVFLMNAVWLVCQCIAAVAIAYLSLLWARKNI